MLLSLPAAYGSSVTGNVARYSRAFWMAAGIGGGVGKWSPCFEIKRKKRFVISMSNIGRKGFDIERYLFRYIIKFIKSRSNKFTQTLKHYHANACVIAWNRFGHCIKNCSFKRINCEAKRLSACFPNEHWPSRRLTKCWPATSSAIFAVIFPIATQMADETSGQRLASRRESQC